MKNSFFNFKKNYLNIIIGIVLYYTPQKFEISAQINCPEKYICKVHRYIIEFLSTSLLRASTCYFSEANSEEISHIDSILFSSK